MIAVRARPRWRRPWRLALLGLLVAAGAAGGWFGVRYLPVLRAAASTPGYWRDRAAEPVPPGALRLVALGDSATQGIGATDPADGFVGRIAAHAQQVTGRPVHVQNLARGGNTVADVLRDQLPHADLGTADLVVVETSNDLEQRKPVEDYRRDLTTLLGALPAARTVISDLPLLPGVERYQPVLAEVADRFGVRRADFAAVFTARVRSSDIFSRLPPHLNSTGYWYWYLAFRPQVDQILATVPR